MKIDSRSKTVAAVLSLRRAGPLTATMLSLALIGCGQEETIRQGPSFQLIDPAQRHPIIVSQKPTTLSVPTPAGSSGLSAKSRADVLEFVRQFQYSNSDSGRLVIAAPSGSSNEAAAVSSVQQMRTLLIEAGYPDSMVAVEPYNAGHHSAPAVRLSYMKYVAEGPECGHFPTNLGNEAQNLVVSNAGCANQRNLAAMIVHPSDLIEPRTSSARSGERRAVVWEKYQKGEKTASEKNEDNKINTRNQGGN